MTEFLRNSGEERELEEELRRELLDGPQPGFRRLTPEEEIAMVAEDTDILNALAKNFGGDEDRDIDSHVILSED